MEGFHINIYNLYRLLVITLLFFSQVIYSKSMETNLPERAAFLAGLPKPPFINNDGKGIQLDIIREALLSQNVNAHFTHVPLARSILNYRKVGIDAVSIVPSNFEYKNMFISKPYITYQNVAVSLTERDLSINKIEDLVGLNVAAFQKANQFLGDKFANLVTISSGYREIADQLTQIDMLYTGQTEVIILDVNIFKHFIKSHNEAIYENAFKIHSIFDKKLYSAGFKSETLKNKFEKGISLIRNNGVYQKIIMRYL